MEFKQGLFDNGVLQRNRQNLCDVGFSGACRRDGQVRVTAAHQGKPVAGLEGAVVGAAGEGKFSGVLAGLPVGGPYDLSFAVTGPDGKVHERAVVKNLLVGDLWLLGGQSNMQGCGRLSGAVEANDAVRAYYMDNRWAPAQDPIHNLWQAAAPVHGGNQCKPKRQITGVGPGVAFGQELQRRTGVPQGLVACGHGGTTMAQWDPALKSKGGHSLYGALVERLKALGGKVAGVVWHQGCSDADTTNRKLYSDRMAKLVASVRRDARDPALPFVMAQLGRFCNLAADAESWSSIRDQQRLLPRRVNWLLTVPTIDLALDDAIHLAAESQHVLGRRMAEAALCLLSGGKEGLPPIEPRSVKALRDKDGETLLRVRFGNVDGALQAGGRPAGFSLLDGGAPACTSVIKTTLDGADALVKIPYEFRGLKRLKGLKLCYGHGLDPYCNIHDAAGRPLPAFHTDIKASDGGAPLTSFLGNFELAGPLYLQETADNLDCPAGALDFKPAKLEGFYVCPVNRAELATPEEKVFFYRARLECDEDMDVNLLLGYDGPVRLSCDGAELFQDLKGTNPILRDEQSVAVSLSKGVHELMVALASNRGAAWGFCLRIERPGAKEGAPLPKPLPPKA